MNKDGQAIYRRWALIAAKELGYSPAVLQKIREAKDDKEISRIMAEARRKKFIHFV